MRVPDFMVRQFYVGGSLRNDDSGFRLQARNPLTDGRLVGVRRFAVDGAPIELSSVSAFREGDPDWLRASDVSPTSPVMFRKGDVVTFHVAGPALEPGQHKLDLDLIERDAGLLSLTLSDALSID
jgi:hydroxymethylglutaryl-CoA reductase (NADPH)